MAEANCACTIANIEGLHSRMSASPRVAASAAEKEKENFDSTLEGLDRRARRLETRLRIAPPPPMLDTSWDSLTWRVWRLARRFSRFRALPRGPPVEPMASLALLRSAVAAIDGGEGSFPWLKEEGSGKEKEEEKEEEKEKEKEEQQQRLLKVAAQWLCHAAGRRGIRVPSLAFELAPVCALALNLAFEAETTTTTTTTGGAPYPARPLCVVPPTTANPCRGCACTCHGNKVSNDNNNNSTSTSKKKNSRKRQEEEEEEEEEESTSDDSSSSSYSSRRRPCKARRILASLVERLAFWRRRRAVGVGTDDASSTSSTL
ncbi:uncharacterized protein GGS25DRAFT_529514 [Hypoxylon fragiforme]|uniref:uncharacterized protein n=1 Tax=Hypoxylon fragiforme TaxID=63214 RepID=UPI0020C63B11|nr:uncharacterized protein GGS25DRAFT_529514 [Hypoxylon fragiforme]KAI2613078.1 hypothetical protein GGS25DRAFT_529514 [Hypoxylon fragiforme]